MSYKTTIGLEVHAELKTASKMFCGCKNDPHNAEPSIHTCPVCLAHPGTLPVPNRKAIEYVLMFGKAVGATLAGYSEFDRKNYFYPDIPKAYQISQYAYPFLTDGSILDIPLTRVHLEEDTARSIHDRGDYSLVDFNRAGVPLMELVTEPAIHDAETAGAFARELQLLLRTLNISDANMERGEMRVEANISVSKDSDKLGTKVEVKNLNSFKSVESAIRYEVERQIAVLEAGEEVVQETRGWDEVKLRTFSQRSKETAKDYRYFPDPDIPKMNITEFRLSEIMPKLPNEIRELYQNLGIPSDQIETLLQDTRRVEFLSAVVERTSEKAVIQLAMNYLLSDIPTVLADNDLEYADLSSKYFTELMEMIAAKEINSRTAKDLLKELTKDNDSPRQLVEARGLGQVSDSEALRGIMEQVIAEHENVADEYRNGKEAAANFLVGQGMKATKGSADPGVLRALVAEILS